MAGQITISAKNIIGNASGTIQDDAKTIKNIAGGKFTQNGKNGVNNDKNEERKTVSNLRVVKVTSVDEKIEINKNHTFTATEFTRDASGIELMLVKWAYQFDDGEIYYCPIVAGQNAGEAVFFKLVFAQDTSFVFENPKHDFPQKVVYEFHLPDNLYAYIEGMDEGVFSRQEYFG